MLGAGGDGARVKMGCLRPNQSDEGMASQSAGPGEAEAHGNEEWKTAKTRENGRRYLQREGQKRAVMTKKRLRLPSLPRLIRSVRTSPGGGL